MLINTVCCDAADAPESLLFDLDKELPSNHIPQIRNSLSDGHYYGFHQSEITKFYLGTLFFA